VVVEHGAEGVLQSELWKELTLTSRDGSRLAIRLERRGMIRREKVLDGGRWTYKLTALRMPAHIQSIQQAPCITCPYESKCSLTGVVSPLSCPWICEWVLTEFKENVLVCQAGLEGQSLSQSGVEAAEHEDQAHRDSQPSLRGSGGASRLIGRVAASAR
jgi:hypothetical protein